MTAGQLMLKVRGALTEGMPVREIVETFGIPEESLRNLIGDGFWAEMAAANDRNAPRKAPDKRAFKAKSPENYLKGRNHRLLSFVASQGGHAVYVGETYNLKNALAALQDASPSTISLLAVSGVPLSTLEGQLGSRVQGKWWKITKKNAKILGIAEPVDLLAEWKARNQEI